MADPTIEKTCLLIIPKKFYSFEKIIAGALKEKGYTVTVSNDEYPENAAGKIMGKLRLPFLFDITYKTIKENFLIGKTYDIAVIFKGRGISEKLISEMKKSVKRIVAYNWDSFKYNPNPLEWYKSVDKYATFDFADGDNYGISVVELFTSSSAIYSESEIEKKYELSYIVRNHSQRLQYLDKILKILNPKDVYIYIYELNKFTLLANFIKNPSLYIKYRKFIFHKPLDYKSYTDAIKYSMFTIDYAHTDQTGITMRCYEASKMRTRIITNNYYLKRSEYFDPSNSIIYSLQDNPEELLADYEECRNSKMFIKNREISKFIDELLSK